MKNHLFRAFSILAVISLLFALGLSSTAQQTTREQQPAQQQELRIPELAVQEIDSETLRVRVPRECAGIRPDVQTHDVADNFAPPGNPVTLSPALTTFLNGRPVKGYDDKRVDTIFADTFRLKSCRICYASLDLRVRHQPGPWIAGASNYSNDTILAGAAPFTAALRFMGPANIWSSDLPNPKPFTLSTTPASLNNLNQYLFTNTPAYLDVIAQDDTDFDSATLSVWYY
jgi:hypothetical protein